MQPARRHLVSVVREPSVQEGRNGREIVTKPAHGPSEHCVEDGPEMLVQQILIGLFYKW